jgi:hypothetical protein
MEGLRQLGDTSSAVGESDFTRWTLNARQSTTTERSLTAGWHELSNHTRASISSFDERHIRNDIGFLDDLNRVRGVVIRPNLLLFDARVPEKARTVPQLLQMT